MPKYIIGRTDIADFPEFGLTDLRVKIDTGAYTSAIHCYRIKILKDGRLSFYLPAHRAEKHKRFITDKFELKAIKNSFGNTEMRFVIKTTIVLFGRKFKTEFSLADRTQMRFPVLLGRKLLRKHFLVDVSGVNLSYLRKQSLSLTN